MGLEAECTVRVGRRSSAGRALLEGETLIFRGADLPLKIAFSDIREATVDGDELVVTTADREARFDLGAAVAERWLRFVKEPRGLFEKLEIGPHSRVAVVDITDAVFLAILRERAAGVAEGRVPEGAPVVFFGAETREALRRLPLLRARMVPTGILWVVRPKGSRAIAESDVFDAVRLNSLVEVKVVAFSKTHTAHKCVIPVELRGLPVRPPPIISIPPSAPLLPAKARPAKPSAKPAARKASPARPAKVEAEKKKAKAVEGKRAKDGKKRKGDRKKDKKKDKKGKRRK
jgi:hypothetical protein